jgi:hypothetical protein
MSDENTTMEAKDENVAPNMEGATERAPRTHVDSSPLPTDSMVTVPLSPRETDRRTPEDEEEGARESIMSPQIVVEERRASSRTNSAEIRQAFGGRRSSQASEETPALASPTVSVRDTDAPVSPKSKSSERGRRTSNGSGKSEEVDWAELEKKEEQEPEGEEEVGPERYAVGMAANTHRLWHCCSPA